MKKFLTKKTENAIKERIEFLEKANQCIDKPIGNIGFPINKKSIILSAEIINRLSVNQAISKMIEDGSIMMFIDAEIIDEINKFAKTKQHE